MRLERRAPGGVDLAVAGLVAALTTLKGSIATFLAAEMPRWADAVKRSGARLD